MVLRSTLYDFTKNCTVMDPSNDYKWDPVDCTDTSSSVPVCEYPHPPDDIYIEETTGE